MHLTQQLAKVNDDMLDFLEVDVRNVSPQAIERFDVTVDVDENYEVPRKTHLL